MLPLENLFCKRIMRQKEEAEKEAQTLKNRIYDLSVKIINLEREKNSVIGASEQEKSELLKRISQLEAEKTLYLQEISNLRLMLADKVQQSKYSPEFYSLSEETQKKLIAYENKYNKVILRYPARFAGKNPRDMLTIDVRTFLLCGINDSGIIGWCNDKRTRVKYIMEDYKNKLTYEQACEIAFSRVNGRLPVPYAFDEDRWGSHEFWEFAPETFYGMFQRNLSFDCDSFAILKYILYRVSGIPDEMIRFVAGTTYTDEGHATTAFYSPTLGYWVHGNSTTRYVDDDKIEKFYRIGDSREPLNIKIHWWSSTSRFSHYEMLTQAQKEEVERRRNNDIEENRLISRVEVSYDEPAGI